MSHRESVGDGHIALCLERRACAPRADGAPPRRNRGDIRFASTSDAIAAPARCIRGSFDQNERRVSVLGLPSISRVLIGILSTSGPAFGSSKSALMPIRPQMLHQSRVDLGDRFGLQKPLGLIPSLAALIPSGSEAPRQAERARDRRSPASIHAEDHQRHPSSPRSDAARSWLMRRRRAGEACAPIGCERSKHRDRNAIAMSGTKLRTKQHLAIAGELRTKLVLPPAASPFNAPATSFRRPAIGRSGRRHGANAIAILPAMEIEMPSDRYRFHRLGSANAEIPAPVARGMSRKPPTLEKDPDRRRDCRSAR